MIQKCNNISFKQIYMFPTITGLAEENRPKINEGIKMIKNRCGNKDVFLGADNKGELTIQVQRSEPLLELLTPDIGPQTGLSPKELLGLVSMAMAYKAKHMSLYNEKLPVFCDKTKGIDRMSKIDIAKKIQETIDKFNEKFKEPLN